MLTRGSRPAIGLTVPIGIIQAITSNQLGLNVITELIIGYMVPGHPIAMMQFKVRISSLLVRSFLTD